MTIWTIGHSTRTLVEVVEMLKENDINLLVDVRSYPGSRLYPHFNKENLTNSIPASGIEYTHILDLGGRRSTNKNSLNTTWRLRAFRGYADHMETEIFKRGFDRLESLARNCNVCYMCSEAWYVQCHRSLISDKFASEQWIVNHIVGKSKTGKPNVKRHKYTQPARIENGVLTYHPLHQPQKTFDFVDSSRQ